MSDAPTNATRAERTPSGPHEQAGPQRSAISGLIALARDQGGLAHGRRGGGRAAAVPAGRSPACRGTDRPAARHVGAVGGPPVPAARGYLPGHPGADGHGGGRRRPAARPRPRSRSSTGPGSTLTWPAARRPGQPGRVGAGRRVTRPGAGSRLADLGAPGRPARRARPTSRASAQLLVALACGLDLGLPEDVERLAEHRRNLFRLNPRPAPGDRPAGRRHDRAGPAAPGAGRRPGSRTGWRPTATSRSTSTWPRSRPGRGPRPTAGGPCSSRCGTGCSTCPGATGCCTSARRSSR